MSVKKTWENVYALRQEYNKYQKKWSPCILFWNKLGGYSWITGLFMETDGGFYTDVLAKCHYSDVTKRGVGKCDPADVKAIMDYFLDGQDERNWQEVSKLSVFCPPKTRTLMLLSIKPRTSRGS